MAAIMRAFLHKLRTFLTAEEVPRWFGLSLVLIYLVGLGSIAQYAISQVRQEAAVHFQRSGQYAVKMAARQLSQTIHGLPEADADYAAPEVVATFNRVLREFAVSVPSRWLRIVDGKRRVVAATVPEQIGQPAAPLPVAGSSSLIHGQPVPIRGTGSGARTAPDLFYRIRLASWGADRVAVDPAAPELTADTDSRQDLQSSARATPDPAQSTQPPDGPRMTTNSAPADTALYLEALLPSEPVDAASLANQASMLAIVLVVLGALGVVYRCLREQLRGVSNIAGRLSAYGGRRNRHNIEEDLRALRVAEIGSVGLDDVTRSWNELIDLTQTLLNAEKRARANEELSKALKQSGGGALADAFGAVPDGVIYIREGTRFEYVNPAARRLLGFSADDARDITLATAQSAGVGERVLEVIRSAQSTETSRGGPSFEERSDLITDPAAVGADADAGAYRVRVFPVRRHDHEGECVVMIHDVSQQVRSEHAREEFITNVTHELRTPLTNIRAYTETLSSGMFDDPNVITECYNVITKETRRLSRLIEDILSVSQMEVGTVEIEMGTVDLRTLLTDAVTDVRGLAEEKNIDLQLVLPSKLEPVEGDRDKLAVVLNNLLGNAIKYTPREGTVVVGCQATPDEVVISIKDNGIGIDPADQARVFEKFQRASDPNVQNETGTGIGLYTAREIVRRHRGHIELISQRGEGSTFLVRLPRRAGAGSPGAPGMPARRDAATGETSAS